MNKKFSITIISLLFATMGAHSQVTIGSSEKPSSAALLDLKTTTNTAGGATTTTGGLLLPRVELTSLTSLAPFISGGGSSTDKTTNKGLVVYNLTNNTIFKPGLYTWDGAQWVTYSQSSGVGALTANNGLTLSGTNLQLGGTLTTPTTVTGSTTNTLTLNAPTTVGANLTVTGTTALKNTGVTGNLTVTGNETVGGTLGVTGATTLTGNLTSNGTTTTKATNVTGAMKYTNTTPTVGQYLSASNADGTVAWTTLPATATNTEPWRIQGGTTEATAVTDNAYMTGNLAVGSNSSGAYKLQVTGNTNTIGTATTTGNAVVTGDTKTATSTVTGNETVGGTLVVAGTTTLTGNLTVGGTLGVTGATTIASTGSLTLAGNGAATGKVLTSDASGKGTWTLPNVNGANNGLSITSNNVGLGGTLSKATTIAQGSQSFAITSTNTSASSAIFGTNNAILNLTGSNKGLMLPRVSLTSATDATTIPLTSSDKGMLVYNIGATLGEGFYTWNGASWKELITQLPPEGTKYTRELITTSTFTGDWSPYTFPDRGELLPLDVPVIIPEDGTYAFAVRYYVSLSEGERELPINVTSLYNLNDVTISWPRQGALYFYLRNAAAPTTNLDAILTIHTMMNNVTSGTTVGGVKPIGFGWVSAGTVILVSDQFKAGDIAQIYVAQNPLRNVKHTFVGDASGISPSRTSIVFWKL